MPVDRRTQPPRVLRRSSPHRRRKKRRSAHARISDQRQPRRSMRSARSSELNDALVEPIAPFDDAIAAGALGGGIMEEDAGGGEVTASDAVGAGDAIAGSGTGTATGGAG